MTSKKKHMEETVSKEMYLRLAADFDNARKEHVRSLELMAKAASEPVVHEVLDLLDALDDAISHAPDTVKDEGAWFTGIGRVREQFVATLERIGVTRIETAEQPFDPVTMEAVGTVPGLPGQGGEPNTVQSEQRAGWRMHDRAIRPARVVVYQ